MKDFLLIANKNCITYKEFFPLIKDRKVNIGYTHPGDFDQPEEDTHKSMQGLTRWFTTLSTASKPPLVLTKTYDPEKYKHYDNYDAINVDRVKDIPWDYDGVMGVPITILDHNLDNVEIVSNSDFAQEDIPGWSGVSQEFYDMYYKQGNTGQIEVGWSLPHYIKDGKAIIPYKRVLIKKNFEIDGCFNNYTDPDPENGLIIGTPTKVSSTNSLFRGPAVNEKAKYFRVLIKKNFEIDGCLYGDHTIIDGTYIKGHTPEIDGKHKYSRILIKKK